MQCNETIKDTKKMKLSKLFFIKNDKIMNFYFWFLKILFIQYLNNIKETESFFTKSNYGGFMFIQI